MERLNLYGRKVKVVKLTTFLLLLVIAILPALTLFIFSAQWVSFQLERTLASYPRVLNKLSSFSARNVMSQLETLRGSINNKLNETRRAIAEVTQEIARVERDTYVLKLVPFIVASNPNRLFLQNLFYDGSRFILDFYEYGVETKVGTSTLQALLAREFPNVTVNLVEERTFYGELKYFRYRVEGSR